MAPLLATGPFPRMTATSSKFKVNQHVATERRLFAIASKTGFKIGQNSTLILEFRGHEQRGAQ